MTIKGTVASIIYNVCTIHDKDTQFSLKCEKIHPGIHKDPMLRLRATYNILVAADVAVARIVNKLYLVVSL